MSPHRWVARPFGRGLSNLSLILLALAGCSRNATNPLNAPIGASAYQTGALAAGPSVSGAFFPLQIGNRWHAEADNRYRLTPLNGGPVDEILFHDDITRVLIGTQTISGQTYVVEADSTEETSSIDEQGSILNWIRYRQDASGLYEADVAASEPPALSTVDSRTFPATFAEHLPDGQRAAYAAAWGRIQQRAAALRGIHRHASIAGTAGGPPGGIQPDEITRLRYPLRPGAEWIIRDDPFFGSVVEANEILEVPAGRFPSHRIRIISEFFGPNDVVHTWFSRSGMLALRYHLESIATDVDGNEIGSLSFDYDETLRDFSLVGP